MGDSVYSQAITAGCDIWMPSQDTVWEQGTVLAVTKSMATIRTARDDVVQLDLATIPCFLANPTLASDVTALHYIHEPGILYNLEQRSGANEPYTLLGSVLVAVNPLKVIPDPDGIVGQKKAAQYPHPYGIAEIAYSQMVFAENRKAGKSTEDVTSNQSIVISGESGSGKTESSKYVLKHLVTRNEAQGGEHALDTRLLSSNPILEAFGNASTLRNHNSSRFGKFLKLHFLGTPRPGDTALWTIGGASVVTYLLERSRITSHNNGERGYHVFYQLRDGAPGGIKSSLGLDLNGGSFRYMIAKGDQKIPPSATKMKMNDKEDFTAFDAAWGQMGIASNIKDMVFKTLAGILHLGNVEFVDEEKPEGNVAVIKPGGYGALEWAGKMLGVEPVALGLMFREHEVQAGSELVLKRRDAKAASYARDATAKALYSQLFEWVVETINESLDLKKGKSIDSMPFIGVLDIFGFESFERNDFEQLLINYTNEALQGTFNRQVFVAEMDLYKREGLIVGDGGMTLPPDNSACMMLLAGKDKTMGLLKMIDAESQTPQASDEKMNKQLHRAFEKNECFMKPHPKDIATTFIVRHYAGAVVYTVGRFIEKNADRVPKEVGATFEKSSLSVVASLFAVKDKAAAAKRAFGGASIIGKFTTQIANLITTLEATRDSFIRCVKPNPSMVRTADLSWFDRRYVTQQLKCLSIPQTAEVLKSGLPTRIPYETLTENYMSVLPADAISIWKRLGKGEMRGFIMALFWAFEVRPDSYRTGMTRVFFKSGELTTLDKIMESANKWKTDPSSKAEQEKIVKRFKFYYVRTLWRKAIVKTICINNFNKLFARARGKMTAATKIEALARMKAQKRQFNRTKRGALMAQKLWRAKKARQVAAKLRQEAIEEARRKKAEALRLEEEARLRAIAEAEAAERARKQAEKEASEAAEAEKAAAEARLAQLRTEEEERAKRAAEEAIMLKKKRMEAEEEERKKLDEDEVRRKKEEEEYKELQTRLEKEEAERAAEEAMEKGRGKTDGKARAKSVVREMRKSVAGLTAQQKAQKVKEAEASILAEKEAWANKGKVGYLNKLEKGGLFSGKKPKKLFFMLRMVQSELEIYVKGNSAGMVGEPKGKPKAVWKFTRQLTCSPIDDAKNPLGKYVFELSDPKSGKLQLGCESEGERQEWAAAFKRAAEGFKASAAADEALKKANALQITAGVGAEQPGEYDNIDISKLSPEAQEQIAKIESLYETGLLTKLEMDQLKPIIIAQDRETNGGSVRQDQEEYDHFPTNGNSRSAFKPMTRQVSAFEELGYISSDSAAQAMVVCEVCSILNMHGGAFCMVCSAPLPKADDPAQQNRVRNHRMSMQVVSPMHYGDFGPSDGKWLCALPFRNGGTFRCFVKDSASVMDQQTWSQTALYILGCEFVQGMMFQEQWTARHNWAWFEKWDSKMRQQNLIPNPPPFPTVDPVEASSTNPGTMAKLKGLLSLYLGELLACVKDSEGFLKSDLADKMFKIKENIQEELNFEQFNDVYNEVLSADMSASDSNVPLSREEMEIADDAGTLLITFIRGDGTTKPIDVFDERVQDLHSVCLTAIPRLRASQDVENPAVIKELVPHALDVLEHLENAIRVYNDTMSIAQARMIVT